ncbi:MAG: hypothetical protein AAF634_10875 [Bacteroidota bacterium]
MKAYKIRSFIYLSIFIAAAAVYYHIEQNEILQDTLFISSVTELEVEPAVELEAQEEAKK